MGKSIKHIWLLPKPSRLFRYLNATSWLEPSWSRAFNSEILAPAAPQHFHPSWSSWSWTFLIFPVGHLSVQDCQPFAHPSLTNKLKSWSAADTEQSSKLDSDFQEFTCTQPESYGNKSCTIVFATASRNHKTLRLCCCLALLNTLKQDLGRTIWASEMCRFYLEKLLSGLSLSCACPAQKSEIGTKEHEQI